MLSPALLLSAALTLAAAPSPGLLASSRDDDSLGLREGRRFPSSARLVSGPDWKLVGGGIGILATGYLSSVALGAFVVRDPVLVIPIAGPFIHLATLWSAAGGPSGPSLFWLALPLVAVYSAGLVVLGGVQLAGAILILAGTAQQRPVKVRGVQMVLAPGAGGAPLGASVVGRF